jgi:hypothetical protein
MLNVGVAPEAIPSTVIGEEDPVPVWPVLAVTVKDVAAGDAAGKVKVIVTAPLLNGRDVPTFEAPVIVGWLGSKKLS